MRKIINYQKGASLLWALTTTVLILFITVTIVTVSTKEMRIATGSGLSEQSYAAAISGMELARGLCSMSVASSVSVGPFHIPDNINPIATYSLTYETKIVGGKTICFVESVGNSGGGTQNITRKIIGEIMLLDTPYHHLVFPGNQGTIAHGINNNQVHAGNSSTSHINKRFSYFTDNVSPQNIMKDGNLDYRNINAEFTVSLTGASAPRGYVGFIGRQANLNNHTISTGYWVRRDHILAAVQRTGSTVTLYSSLNTTGTGSISPVSTSFTYTGTSSNVKISIKYSRDQRAIEICVKDEGGVPIGSRSYGTVDNFYVNRYASYTENICSGDYCAARLDGTNLGILVNGSAGANAVYLKNISINTASTARYEDEETTILNNNPDYKMGRRVSSLYPKVKNVIMKLSQSGGNKMYVPGEPKNWFECDAKFFEEGTSNSLEQRRDYKTSPLSQADYTITVSRNGTQVGQYRTTSTQSVSYPDFKTPGVYTIECEVKYFDNNSMYRAQTLIKGIINDQPTISNLWHTGTPYLNNQLTLNATVTDSVYSQQAGCAASTKWEVWRAGWSNSVTVVGNTNTYPSSIRGTITLPGLQTGIYSAKATYTDGGTCTGTEKGSDYSFEYNKSVTSSTYNFEVYDYVSIGGTGDAGYSSCDKFVDRATATASYSVSNLGDSSITTTVRYGVYSASGWTYTNYVIGTDGSFSTTPGAYGTYTDPISGDVYDCYSTAAQITSVSPTSNVLFSTGWVYNRFRIKQ